MTLNSGILVAGGLRLDRIGARPAAGDDVVRTRPLFLAMCCYVMAQAYMIPIWIVGANWSIWPTLADFGVLFVVVGLVKAGPSPAAMSPLNRLVFSLLAFLVCCGALSYVVLTVLVPITGLGAVVDSRARNFGGYFLYRLFQFLAIYWGAARMPMTVVRLRILGRLVKIVLAIVCVPVLLTHLGIISCHDLAPQIPNDLDLAGPWAYYCSDEPGWGTVGYNHAYTAAQILMLASLCVHFSRNEHPLRDACWLCLGLVATFCSGSRAGLAVYVIYLAILGFRQIRFAAWVGGVSFAAVILLVTCFPSVIDHAFLDAVDRQGTILEAQKAENLSGRDGIWGDYWTFLAQNPFYIPVGAGVGASFAITAVSGGAHMLFLTVIAETGILGLVLFVASANYVLGVLFRHESGSRAIAWATACLLITCFTQDTFYPVAAFGHLMGLHWFSMAMALRERAVAPVALAEPNFARLPARVGSLTG